MNVRKRDNNSSPSKIRNAGTSMKAGPTQAKPIKNFHNDPKPMGHSKVRNTVSE